MLKKIIDEIKLLNFNLYKKDFLLTWEKTNDDLRAILLIAKSLKTLRDNNISTKVFDSGLAVSLFRDNSTRTRFSFASACNVLGLQVQDLDEGKSQIAHGETVRETAVMISFLSEVIGIRDDLFIGEGNKYMREVGDSLDDAFQEKILPQRPSIVNLQCDLDHPTQTLADLLHLQHYFGSLENLKGKKLAMTWAYSPSYGKPLSVPQGLIALMTRFGMQVELAYPQGYELINDVVVKAGNFAENSKGSFKIVDSMESAFRDADVVYPKSWAPFSVMQERTELFRKNDLNGIKQLEKQCLANNAKFKSWECNKEKMELTKNGNALYMHCLPADISEVSCEKGEVSSSVFDKYRNQTYYQAGFKPYIIAAMILASKFENIPEVLSALENKNRSRKMI